MFFDSEVEIYYDLLKNNQILSQCVVLPGKLFFSSRIAVVPPGKLFFSSRIAVVPPGKLARFPIS
jgi:hypothetical protein